MADSSDRTHQPSHGSLRPVPWWVAVVAAVLVALSITVTLLWLLSIARSNPQLRIEAIKVGLSVGAGAGGAAALLLAFRRQWLSEHVARDTAYDATERRVTDLYGQAVEQLGHDKAAVRLGGLYALERLAQDYSEHRQSVVDVVCAYLRMPFTSPNTVDSQPVADDNGAGTHQPPDRPADEAASTDDEQELQVRLTAQRLLARHLAFPADHPNGQAMDFLPHTYWDNLRIDLTGAVLVDLNFGNCRLYQADFTRTQFTGHTSFHAAQFSGEAEFREAQFSGLARFTGARFGGLAQFEGAQFGGDAWFGVGGWAAADGTPFNGAAWFDTLALFARARFGEAAWFGGARFGGLAQFEGAQFGGDASFGGAQFNGAAKFGSDVSFEGAQFGGEALFDGAQFSKGARLYGVSASHLHDGHRWPPGWRVAPPEDDSELGQLVPAADQDPSQVPKPQTSEATGTPP